MADLTSHEAPAHAAQALPVMLPAGKLIGRDVILARVYSQLKENKPVLVYGASGIGKTALAATLASAYTELPGGVLWLNVKDTPFPELLARIGRAFNVKEVATSDNPLSVVNTAMNAVIAAKPLVVFDGQINAQAASEFIMRCANKLPVLLLNDEEIGGPWSSVPLGILEPDAAAAMFKSLSPDQTDGIDALMTALDAIPFAIAVAAGTIRTKKQTPAAFLAALPKRPDITSPLLTLTASFGTLTSPLQGLLLLLGATFRGETSAELFSLIAKAPEDTVTQALGVLVQQNLVERFQRYGKPYYRLHDTTHTFAQTWLRGSGRLEGLQTKVRDAILDYARKYSGTPDRLAAEMDNFLAAANWAADQGDLDVANQVAVVLMQAGDFVNSRGYVYELLLLRGMASSSTTAFPAYGNQQPSTTIPFPQDEDEPEEDEQQPDEDEEDEFQPISMTTAPQAASPTPAPATPALATLSAPPTAAQPIPAAPPAAPPIATAPKPDAPPAATAPSIPPAPAATTSTPAPAPSAPATTPDSDDEFDDVAPLDEDDQDADTENEPDTSEVDEDEFPDHTPISVPDINDDLARMRAQLVSEKLSGNRRRQAEILTAMGKEQVKRGQETEAITSYSDALNLHEALSNATGMLTSLEALATLTAKNDGAQAAVLHATRGAKLAEQLRNEPSQRNLLSILGDAHQQLGESEDAIQSYTEALDLARAANDKQNEALILYKLGFAQLDNNDAANAGQTFEDALTLFREQGRRDYEGRTLAGLGTSSGEAEHWPEAMKFYTSALYIARELKDREEEMLRLSDLGHASVEAHQLGQAVLRYRQALHLAYLSNTRENIVSTTVDLARLLVESQRHLDITEMLVEAALKFDPNDRDLKRLTERIQDERPVVPENIQQVQVAGTAQDYAANAYSLLDNP